MGEKPPKAPAEVQLGFGFFNDTEPASESISGGPLQPRASRGGSKSRGLADTLAIARAALLDASLTDVSAHLLLLFEFCEVALTRALDVVPTHSGVPFSDEEYRSLRGIGQAQWLLNEAHSKKGTKSAPSRGKKVKKKTMNDER